MIGTLFWRTHAIIFSGYFGVLFSILRRAHTVNVVTQEGVIHLDLHVCWVSVWLLDQVGEIERRKVVHQVFMPLLHQILAQVICCPTIFPMFIRRLLSSLKGTFFAILFLVGLIFFPLRKAIVQIVLRSTRQMIGGWHINLTRLLNIVCRRLLW